MAIPASKVLAESIPGLVVVPPLLLAGVYLKAIRVPSLNFSTVMPAGTRFTEEYTCATVLQMPQVYSVTLPSLSSLLATQVWAMVLRAVSSTV